jgi:hypothetical protein
MVVPGHAFAEQQGDALISIVKHGILREKKV